MLRFCEKGKKIAQKRPLLLVFCDIIQYTFNGLLFACIDLDKGKGEVI